MTQRTTFLVLVLMSLGCAGEPTGSRSYVAPPQGTLDVQVNVTGDPSTGPGSYGIVLNTNLWADVSPDKVLRASLNTGRYDVSLAPLTTPVNPFLPSAGTSPAWCANVGASPQSVTVVEGVVQTVTFTVDCPPLVGSGQLTVTVAATAVDKPREVPIIITRLNGSQYSQTIAVFTNDSITTPLPVGVHQVAVGLGASCSGVYPSLLPILVPGKPPKIVLRDNGAARVKLTVTCS